MVNPILIIIGVALGTLLATVAVIAITLKYPHVVKRYLREFAMVMQDIVSDIIDEL